MRTCRMATALAVGAGLVTAGLPALAASHSDAPLIKLDPQANITDVYAFIGSKYNNANQKVLNVIVHVRPFSEPGDGAQYEKFSDDARYSIHIADPRNGAEKMRYDFQFSSVTDSYKFKGTILNYGRGTEIGPVIDIGDARQNFTQTYKVTRVVNGIKSVVGSGMIVAPPNVGKRTTPHYNDANGKAVSGAMTFAELDRYTGQAVYTGSNDISLFAGPREDGFFADTPAIFDLLDARILGNDLGQGGGGVDGFKGFNVLAYAIQIPVADLPSVSYEAPFTGQTSGVGVYASVSRPQIRVLESNGSRSSSGPWVQVNRMGNPLFNEVLVAMKDKDNYNASSPTVDKAKFKKYATAPEIIVLVNAVFGTSFVTTGRADLQAVYIPDVLRVDTTTNPVRLAGQSGFSRLSLLGSDLTNNGKASGWPNGRRLGDDVVDIALSAIASGPAYNSITLVGDNINANDQLYNQVFPYSGTPHAGPTNRKDP